MSIFLIIWFGVGLGAVAYVAWLYNQLVQLNQKVGNAYAQIDVQLKRRYELIPSLVEVARGYMAHEKETLEAVVRARVSAVNASKQVEPSSGSGGLAALFGAEALMAGSLSKLMLIAEDYPDLKADANMRQLSEELRTTENRVSFARQAYNDAVMTYNTTRETFPNVLLSGPMGFGPAALFEVSSEAEREAVKVAF